MLPRSYGLISLVALTTGLTGLCAAPALALAPEDLPQTSPADHPAAGASQLDEIVVTARRREERAQDVPIALTVIGGEQLDKSNTYNVGQLTQQAPSVQVLSSNPRNTSITIRGIGASYGLANDGLDNSLIIFNKLGEDVCKICTRSSGFRSFSFQRWVAMLTPRSAVSGPLTVLFSVRYPVPPCAVPSRISEWKISTTRFTKFDYANMDRSDLGRGTIGARIPPGAPFFQTLAVETPSST